MTTSEERVAYINSQIAMMNMEVEVMKAENTVRLHEGHAPAYGEAEWETFHKSWEPILGSNAVTSLFHQ